MEGHGVYVWGADGSVHRGQFMRNLAHGCGVRLMRRPLPPGGAASLEPEEARPLHGVQRVQAPGGQVLQVQARLCAPRVLARV